MAEERATRGFVDAHCHIDLYDDPLKIVEEAERECVYTIAVTNAPSVFWHTTALVANRKYVHAAVGLHPELVRSHGQEVDSIRDLLKQTRYVGEIGLDYTTADQGLRRRQRDVLLSIVEWCQDYGNKVLTLHSRRAVSDVLSCLGDSFSGTPIMHWFTGSAKELDRAVRQGCYFSVNNAMLRSEKGRALVRRMPQERVLTETDGPFVRVGSRAASPRDTKSALREIGALWRQPEEKARETVFTNFMEILRRTTDA